MCRRRRRRRRRSGLRRQQASRASAGAAWRRRRRRCRRVLNRRTARPPPVRVSAPLTRLHRRHVPDRHLGDERPVADVSRRSPAGRRRWMSPWLSEQRERHRVAARRRRRARSPRSPRAARRRGSWRRCRAARSTWSGRRDSVLPTSPSPLMTVWSGWMPALLPMSIVAVDSKPSELPTAVMRAATMRNCARLVEVQQLLHRGQVRALGVGEPQLLAQVLHLLAQLVVVGLVAGEVAEAGEERADRLGDRRGRVLDRAEHRVADRAQRPAAARAVVQRDQGERGQQQHARG